jgi:HAD superfamily hydrolase (TIGR01509 family)
LFHLNTLLSLPNVLICQFVFAHYALLPNVQILAMPQAEVPHRRFKAVLFDIGGVLAYYRDPTLYQDVVIRAEHEPLIAQGIVNFDLGRQSLEELRNIFLLFVPNLPDGDLEKIPMEDILDKADDKVFSAIRKLRKAGIKTAIVTNDGYHSPKKQRTCCLGDVSDFDCVIESCKVGFRKPQPAIFLLTTAKLGVHPRECIFLDDTESHCKAAESIGMTAIHVPRSDTIGALHKLAHLVDIPLV